MAKKPHKKSQKRQPAKKRLPLLREQTSAAASASKKVSKPKRQKNPTRHSKKSVAKRRRPSQPAAKIRPQRKLRLPLGPRARLVISFERSTSAARRAKSRPRTKDGRFAKRPSKSSTRKQLALSGSLILAGLAGSIIFGLQAIIVPAPPAVQASHAPPLQVSVTPAPVVTSLPRSEPVRLKIPDIQLDTTLTNVGLRSDGTLEVPSRFDIAARYVFSPTPGELGPSIIVGHIDSYEGTAVFWRLRELQPGQIIEIDRADGKTARFKVDSVKNYSQNEFPTQEVYGNINYAGLRLITCGGSFNRFTQRYSHNTVVYASLVM